MIFQHTLPQVLYGNKTQTRRIIDTDEVAIRGRYNQIEAVLHNGRTKWCVGKTYAVQPGRGEGQVARIKLTKINSEQITRISSRDALAEGFSNRQIFLQTWQSIHGENSFNLRVWVLTFELIEVINVEKTISLNIPEGFLTHAAG